MEKFSGRWKPRSGPFCSLVLAGTLAGLLPSHAARGGPRPGQGPSADETGRPQLAFPGPDCCRIATFNVENYLVAPTADRPLKPVQARVRVQESILALAPDVLALQEMGSLQAINELRTALRSRALDYPYWEHLTGSDTNIHLALLSRHPITARRPHTNDSFLLLGRRFQISRGILEVDIRVNPSYLFTLMTLHLKSRREVDYADQAELRQEEARILRQKINARLAENPDLNLVVLGDFNDTQDSASVRIVIGRGSSRLVDTRPFERHEHDQTYLQPKHDSRQVTWTHFYGKEDTYSRIDYILISRGMAREWLPAETCIPTRPDWGLASDHRPLVAGFLARDR